jgi:hypothetical protein
MKNLLIAGLMLAGASVSLPAAVVSVDGMSDIFEAGLGTSGTAVGANLGLYPTLALSFTAGAGQTISFNSITGTVKYGGSVSDPSVSADGMANPFGTDGTNITSNTGISGIAFDGRIMFLVGVFLDDNAPSAGSQPATVTFFSSGGGYDADGRVNWFGAPVTFQLGQAFYIGDGRTGFNNAAGTLQVWDVPSTATRLFLGFADGGNLPFSGPFGAYNDNSGALTVDVSLGAAAVPEPGTLMLMGLGLLSVVVVRKKFAR